MLIIDEAIKEKFGTKAEFCKAVGVSPENSTRYVGTLARKINSLNKALAPLDLFLKLRR